MSQSLISSPFESKTLQDKTKRLHVTPYTKASQIRWWQRAFQSRIFEHMNRFDKGAIRIVETFRQADNVRLVGHRQSDDIATLHIHDPRFYTSVALHTDLGLAESYILGWWDTPDLYQFLRLLIKHIHIFDAMDKGISQFFSTTIHKLFAWVHRNTPAGSQKNIHAHYDLGNEFFKTMLDSTMAYSSGIFEAPEITLEEASVAKFERLCQKLDLSEADHLLEIGTGWGGFAIYAARKYGCKITTTTISKAQYEEAGKRIEAAGLEDKIHLLCKDYRELEGQFDKIVSIEMLEAVGHQFLGTFFKQCDRLLRDDGIMALQVITMPDHRYERYRKHVDFIRRYVFPGSCCPSISAMTSAVAKNSQLRLIELTDIGLHYAPTLLQWHERIRANVQAIDLKQYSKQFLRLWDYYLIGCAASFAERYTSNTHLVFAKPGHRHSSVTMPVPDIH